MIGQFEGEDKSKKEELIKRTQRKTFIILNQLFKK